MEENRNQKIHKKYFLFPFLFCHTLTIVLKQGAMCAAPRLLCLLRFYCLTKSESNLLSSFVAFHEYVIYWPCWFKVNWINWVWFDSVATDDIVLAMLSLWQATGCSAMHFSSLENETICLQGYKDMEVLGCAQLSPLALFAFCHQMFF